MVEARNYHLTDDFGDNALTGRSGGQQGVFAHPYNTLHPGSYLKARDRPEWNIIQGSPSATNQELQIPDGSVTVQALSTHSKFYVGSFSLDWQTVTNATSGGFQPHFMAAEGGQVTPDNSYFVDIFEDGTSYDLYKRVAASNTAIISSTWPDDTSVHGTEVTRDPYGAFELFLDAVSQGTVTDTDHVDGDYLTFRDQLNVRVDVDNIDLGPIAGASAPTLGESPLSFYIRDDFGDGSLSGRSGVQTGFYFNEDPASGGIYAGDMLKAIDRPEWDVLAGTASVTAGEIDNPGGGPNEVVATHSSISTGTWEFDFRLGSSPANGSHGFYGIRSTGNGRGWFFTNWIDGQLWGLRKIDSGGSATVINGGGDITDTNSHDVKKTRTVFGDWEVFLDAVSGGTATDGFIPAQIDETRFYASVPVDVFYDNLLVT